MEQIKIKEVNGIEVWADYHNDLLYIVRNGAKVAEYRDLTISQVETLLESIEFQSK